MIEELHIANLAVIQDTTLHFEERNTCLLGETGAGKSLIVNSLGLLVGERCDFSLLRDKEKKAVVSALFTLDDGFKEKHPEVRDYVSADGTLIVKRILNPDKSTRCYLNDEVVSLNEFKRVTSHLIDIHSQNAKSDLLLEDRQLAYLDYYAKGELAKPKKEYDKAYQELLKMKKEYESFLNDNGMKDMDYLNFQIAEIEKYHLKENEIEDLNAEFEELHAKEKTKDAFEEYLRVSQGEIPFDDMIGRLSAALRGFSSTSLEESSKKALEKLTELKNSLAGLIDDYTNLRIDSHRIDEINARLFSLKSLMRKYGRSTSSILSKYEEFKKERDQILNFDSEKHDFEEKLKKKEEELRKLAIVLSSIRKKNALLLSKEINEEMSSLGLRKNGFSISFEEVPLYKEGIDRIEFDVSFNEGIEKSPLKKAASGGEASRLMLALKIVLNALDPYEVLVLDEIDTGVSGKAGNLMARKMQKLDASSLIVISHLPQVIASCKGHIEIRKKTLEGHTFTSAESLDREKTIERIAVMLSGDKVTKEALMQASRLLSEYQG